jgi:hypothetical protein
MCLILALALIFKTFNLKLSVFSSTVNMPYHGTSPPRFKFEPTFVSEFSGTKTLFCFPRCN